MISRKMRLWLSIKIISILNSKLIDSNVTTVKKTKQGQDSLYVTNDARVIPTEDITVSLSSNDESEDTLQSIQVISIYV